VKRSVTTQAFWRCFDALPREVQNLAVKSYLLWQENPSHPSLHFKSVHPKLPIVSVRVGMNHRAVAMKADDGTFVGIGSGHTRSMTG
jgi:hypothetical protein